MTGSLSIRGEVLPVGGITAKIEAAAEAGMKRVLIPSANIRDVLIDKKYQDKIEVIPVGTLSDVLENSIVGAKKKGLIEKLSKFIPTSKKLTIDAPLPSTELEPQPKKPVAPA
jgi:Lon-like ATP-dependent protease